MTSQQFRKFQIDWDIFAKITNMLRSQTNIYQYNSTDEAVQNAIVNTHPDFFTTNPNTLLGMVEVLSTQETQPHHQSSYFCLYVAEQK